ncbi:hypothetical protein PN419_00280 [Halorubrum ezzemoulense]|uniref:hypothetical protein n=1 Tax=Halorubrum ezzemoulense TaxID=337243 RepID=UPI00232EFB10|nr:hypothetical protein [Halorubrum ezzemoulense]MDB9247443.1 hypothetical protein [Halorubrum ezzemoulense]MDB9258648.1 hypothetical protein [Halorubrum ezzemoulense]MDB9264494.1 hypothetical protein [Halorubrum ezzemoulense]MDB9269009.1 hypothetical protein [Halorubrum ezzemoulense]MDB9271462.1 hypothetical protein [Halorubrum ezzemoulense]
MPTDIKIDEQFTATLDARGDFKTVDGDRYLVQRAILRIRSVNVSWLGKAVTPQRAEDYRSAVEERIQDDDEIDVGVSVRVTNVTDTEVTLTVDIGDQQLIVTGP